LVATFVHLPAERRVGMRRDLLHALHAQLRAVGVEHERVAAVLDQREAQLAVIEGAGAVGVRRGDEADESGLGRHVELLAQRPTFRCVSPWRPAR